MPTRALWKGAISFGLVHIPVALHSATSDSHLDFDWLDKRSMEPVGYKRINKNTGEEVTPDNIIKGIKYKNGQYVVLSDEEIRAAYPKTTQTIDIECFVDSAEIAPIFFERPYYIAPVEKSAKVYALLREALLQTKQVGLARVVIQTKQHLAMLMPAGAGLQLNLLRWAEEIRATDDLELPAAGAKAAGLSDREIAMATQLVKDMAGPWDPGQFTDSFRQGIMALVERKAREGKLETVPQAGEAEEFESGEGAASGQVIDLTELLQRSLRKGNAPATSSEAASKDKEKPKATAKAKANSATRSRTAAAAAKTRAAPKRRAA